MIHIKTGNRLAMGSCENCHKKEGQVHRICFLRREIVLCDNCLNSLKEAITGDIAPNADRKVPPH